MTYPYIISGDSLTMFINGRSRTIHKDNKHFEAVKDAVRRGDFDNAIKALDISEQIVEFGEGNITVQGGIVYYGDYPLHNSMTTRILEMIKEGFDSKPLMKFLDRLMKNPSKRAVDELYGFLEVGKLPITPDGYFLAYKKVTDEFKDYRTGKFDNSPGRIVEMLRNFVDEDKDNTCSTGLHFCSLSYLRHYYGNQGKVIILKIDPADVVSIPSDYNNTKGRACRYEVLEEYTGPETEHAFTSPVVHYDDEIESEEDSWEEDSWEDDSWDGIDPSETDSWGNELVDDYPLSEGIDTSDELTFSDDPMQQHGGDLSVDPIVQGANIVSNIEGLQSALEYNEKQLEQVQNEVVIPIVDKVAADAKAELQRKIDLMNDDQASMGIVPPKDEDIRPFTPEESAALDSYKGEEITLDGGTFRTPNEPIVITRILDGTITIPTEEDDNGPETRTIPDHPDLNNNGVPDEVEALVGSVRKFYDRVDLEYMVVDFSPVPDSQGTWYLITKVVSTGYLGSREFDKVILDPLVKKD